MYLKQKHELLALKVSLTRERRQTSVRMELETHKGGTPSVLLERTVTASEIGLSRTLDARQFPTFRFPPLVSDEMARLIGELGLEPSHPLWLHLESPYGYLGVVPWEQLLVPVLQRPLLRLPGFLEPPRERKGVLDVALVCSMPISEPSFNPPDVVPAMSLAMLDASQREQTTVHVFADKDYYSEIRGKLTGERRVIVHDPDEAVQFGFGNPSNSVPDDASTVTCPWLRWIGAAMRGRSLDTVHFLCHGYLANERPAFSVAESPVRNEDRWTAHVLSVREVVAFLNQTGAWSVAFSAPPNNYSEAGLRLFADTLAQTRPGPVLYHDASRDFSLSGLRSAYRFLFAPEPSEPPPPAPMFIYCQPALVDTQIPVVRQAQSPGLDAVVSQNAPIFDEMIASDDRPERSPAMAPGAAQPAQENVPNWVAAAQRYVEGAAFTLQRQDTMSERKQTSRNVRNASVAEETLRDAQEIIAKYARQSIDAARKDNLGD
jgi:hypothetical protein